MKQVYSYLFLLVILFMLGGCVQKVETATSVVNIQTPIPTPKLEFIPIVIGETPATDANAIVGAWQAENFVISSRGNISGKLKIILNRLFDFPHYQDVLVIQVLAYYTASEFGDMLLKSTGEFIPIKALRSTPTSATFNVEGDFNIPPLTLEAYGEMPLHHFQVTMVWYRLTQVSNNGYSGYQGKIGAPQDFSDKPWWGSALFDQTVSLNGAVDTNVISGPEYFKWFSENVVLPTNTPVVYPAPPITPSQISTQPYPTIP